MAHIIASTTSPFFGSPLSLTITSGTKPINASFHRVMLKVTIACNGKSYEPEPLSQPSSFNGCSVDFDISSCLRAVHEQYQYSVVTSTVSYPIYNVSVTAYDEWVVNGDTVTGSETDAFSGSFVAGRYSDYERMTGTSTAHSRKPISGELVFAGDRIVYSVSEGLAPASRTHNVLLTTQPGPIEIGQRTYFVIPRDPRSHQFQFVNSRGVVESIRGFDLSSEKVNIKKSESTYSVFERLNTFSRTLMHKTLQPSVFHMSSGYVDYAWARWWAYEFCAADQHWMMHEGRWIPAHVSLSDSTTVIDKAKSELLHVDFDVVPDLNGALW